MTEKERLTDLFRRLGANDPEGWASSQVDEGINQIGRFLFLREAWKRVINENDQAWVQQEIEGSEKQPGAPGSGLGISLRRLLSIGASEQDIVDVARHVQWQLLSDLCCLLDDPGDLEEEVKDIYWGLFQLNANDDAVTPIEALHESVLEMDPTGREMRPQIDKEIK